MSADPLFDNLVLRLKNCIELSKDSQKPKEEVLKEAEKQADCTTSFTGDTAVNIDLFSDKFSNMFSSRSPEYIKIVDYEDERQMSSIMRLITKDLSEPYSIYTYRYFIHNWPSLCFLALDTRIGEYVGAIVCKLDRSRQDRRRGYIAMLAVDESCRKMGIGTSLVERAIANMRRMGCDEVVLETEVTNIDAMRLYSNLGFIREKRLFRYYLNGVDAFRLKLFFTPERDDFEHGSLFADSFY